MNIYATYRNGIIDKAFGFMKGNSMTPGVPTGPTIEEAIAGIAHKGQTARARWGYVKLVATDLGQDVYIIAVKKKRKED